MKSKLFKNKNSIIIVSFCLAVFLLQIPNTYNKQSYNLLLSQSINNVGSSKFGLLSKITIEDNLWLYLILIVLYFITLVMLSLFLGKLLNSSKQKDDILLLSLVAIPILCPFGFSLYFTSSVFSLFGLITFMIGSALFILSFENKHPVVIIALSILSIILHPIIFLILFPSVFMLFVLNNPYPKESTKVQIIILSVCYLISSIVSFTNSTSLIIIQKTLLSNLYELIFLIPLITLVFYIFISAIRDGKKKNTNYYLSLFLFVFPIPLIFICNSFYIYLSASLGGQMILLLYYYLKEDHYIVRSLKKIQTLFSKNIPAFLLFIFYLTYLAFVLENHLGFIGSFLRNKYL